MNVLREGSPAPPPQVIESVVQIEQPQQPYDDDEHSGEIREYNGVFEGPEKTLGTYIQAKWLWLIICLMGP